MINPINCPHWRTGECTLGYFGGRPGRSTCLHDCRLGENPPKPPVASAGVGTELSRMLAAVGIHPTPTCPCKARAAEMDRRGVAWCKENIELIVAWLREEAERRRLPFAAAVGRVLVRRAIRRVEK